ncbi:MAG TPA: hypothetical protein VFI24_12940 [Pyrinomonadaceae bacterium]|nr:hypothetical protein [Pyrinomonadaceae bacterium]
MNAIGFSPVASEEDELDKLREACKRLNFTIRAIKDAQASLSQINLGEVRERLNNAQWQAREAKKLMAEVGKQINGTRQHQKPSRLRH